MFILKDSEWKKLPILDFRGRFFVETCYELLHVDTPPFHQSRLMNIISATEEVLISISDYVYDEKNVRNLINSIEELISCFNSDLIAEKVFYDYKQHLDEIFKHSKSNEKFSHEKLRRLELLCKNILNKETIYFEVLTQKLKEVIVENDVDLTQKHRLNQSLYTYTGFYITYLLSKNYSPKYLYNRTEYFTRLNNYKTRNFNQQFEHVISILNNRIDSYTVCFALHTRHLHKFDSLTKIFTADIRFDISDIFEDKDIQKINPTQEYNIYVLVQVETTDYVSASFMAKEKLESIIDLMNFHDLLLTKDINSTCLTKVNINEKAYIKEVKIGTLLSFVTATSNKEYYKYFDFMLNLNDRLELESAEKLQRSMHYLRLSKDTDSLEQKLLNIWIALESLFDNQHNTIIGNVVNYIPKVYAIASIKERLKYIFNLLVKFKIKIPEDIRTEYNITAKIFTRDIDISIFYQLFYDEKSIEEIFSSIEEKEFLKFRMYSTYLELKDSKGIKSRIDKTTLDVDRQLKRIYVVRNKLTHQAYHGNVRGQIVNHLFEYTMMCYEAIFTTLENCQNSRRITLDHALQSYQMGTENFYNNLKNNSIVYSTIDIKPII